ncbi:ethanolamine utilization protein EutN [Desulfobotulus alkaliphilus]|uniref:Ethanolamine utilization protein EutN n=1 Tax=Desulfobotulus alkaliphilus TaxID=622671 RepID=A0A562RVM8_9BACT|nr:EutN/CcmL family microcompartment protein [Desulfobotulus alkaliphilus]TWI73018.1 ethanolamine utilization protein EutN [Desulfobotulus alkaliphilus]
MIIGEVIGNVWATRKEDTLNGLKLMVVRRVDAGVPGPQESFVAVDCVGAGIGERVLVVTGSSARKALHNQESPVDATIVGIIDEVEVR